VSAPPEVLIREMADELDRLRAELDLLKRWAVNRDNHGLKDLVSGTGNQRYGGGKMRIDQTGMLLLLAQLSTSTQIAWLSAFASTIADKLPRVVFNAYLSGGEPQFFIENRESNDAYGRVNITHSAAAPTVSLQTFGAGSGDTSVYLIGHITNTFARFKLDDSVVLLLGSRTSDPSAPEDGMLWYRSNTGKFLGRAGGAYCYGYYGQ